MSLFRSSIGSNFDMVSLEKSLLFIVKYISSSQPMSRYNRSTIVCVIKSNTSVITFRR